MHANLLCFLIIIISPQHNFPAFGYNLHVNWRHSFLPFSYLNSHFGRFIHTTFLIVQSPTTILGIKVVHPERKNFDEALLQYNLSQTESNLIEF